MSIQELRVDRLTPHPRSEHIYGEEDVSELAEIIQQSGWVKALLVTPDNIIISGNRRWKAVRLLGWETVPVEVREFPDEMAELETLLWENALRPKTIEQKVREANAWKDLERDKARERMRSGGRKSAPGRPIAKGSENFRTLSLGRTVDIIAARVGLGSGRNYEKAAKVVAQIDLLAVSQPEIAQALRKVLNSQSVDAAYQLLKKPSNVAYSILSAIARGEASNTKQALQTVEDEARENTTKKTSEKQVKKYTEQELQDAIAQALVEQERSIEQDIRLRLIAEARAFGLKLAEEELIASRNLVTSIKEKNYKLERTLEEKETQYESLFQMYESVTLRISDLEKQLELAKTPAHLTYPKGQLKHRSLAESY